MFDKLRTRIKDEIDRFWTGSTEAERQMGKLAHQRALAQIEEDGRAQRRRIDVDALGRTFSTHREGMETARRLMEDGRPDAARAAALVGNFTANYIISMAAADGASYQELMDIVHQDAIDERKDQNEEHKS